jgi:hypothetical protein
VHPQSPAAAKFQSGRAAEAWCIVFEIIIGVDVKKAASRIEKIAYFVIR